MCTFRNPLLREKREAFRLINDQKLSKLEEVAKNFPVKVEPPLKYGDPGFNERFKKLFPFIPNAITHHYGKASPFADMPNRNDPIPVEMLKTMVEESCLALDGDHERIKDFYAEYTSEADGAKWEEIRKDLENVLARELYARKVAAVVVDMGLKAKKTKPQIRLNRYSQLNLSNNSLPLKFMDKQWIEQFNALDVLWTRGHNINTAARQILAMIGGIGNWTPLHIDWTSAINVAFAVMGEGLNFNHKLPLAIWYFIQPAAIPMVHEWLKEVKQITAGLGCGRFEMPRLTEEDFDALRKYCGVDEESGEYYVTKVEQFHGHWIEFEPGMLHQVINLQPCVKFAYDTYKFCRLQQYINVWMYLICQFMAHDRNANDYMQILGLIVWELVSATELK
jgi:hypothetical protein